jgi:hypothetical protein
VKLNSMSVGGGLALVAAALLANAAASLVGSGDKVAHADELRQAAKSQPVADVPVSRAEEGGAELAAGTAAGGCYLSEGKPLSWFGAIREIGECAAGRGPYLPPGQPFLYADVDSDGRSESFYSHGGYVYHPTVPSEPCFLSFDDLSFDGEEIAVERSCVLTNEALAKWLVPNTGWEIAYLGGTAPRWSDVDGDGDLDLCMIVDCLQGCDSGGQVNIWLENTGFEKQTFAAGDINQDGEVDGVDISILLSDWTY